MSVDELFNKNEKKLKIISIVIGIMAVFLTAIVILYQFLSYLSDIQWFNYWGISHIFYSQNSDEVINGLIYGFGIICIIIFFIFVLYMQKLKGKKDNKAQIMLFGLFFLLNVLTELEKLYNNKINSEYLLLLFITSALVFLLLRKMSSNLVNDLIKIKDDLNNNRFVLKNIVPGFLIVIIILFVLTILYGNIKLSIEKEFMIIQSDDRCQVVLYAKTDYYIISECVIDKNNMLLTIYSEEQTKIDNAGITYRYQTFEKVEKR